MAALNLAHDFQRERRPPPVAHRGAAAAIDVPALRRRIAGMQSAIDQVLAPGTEKLL